VYLQPVAGDRLVVSKVLQCRRRRVFELLAFEIFDKSFRVPLPGSRHESAWVNHLDLVLEPNERLNDAPNAGELVENALEVLL